MPDPINLRTNPCSNVLYREESVEPETRPCFLLDLDTLTRTVGEFHRAFPGIDLYYAVKANPHAKILDTLTKLDCGFEAASWHEIESLLGLGVPASRIIYGTAVKPRTQVVRAVAAGVDCFAADSREEISTLAAVAPKSRVFIRALGDDSCSVFQFSAKFGAPLSEVAELVKLVRDSELIPWGVSFNVGSQSTCAKAWGASISALAPILRDLAIEGIQLEVINIGGGFPAPYDNHPEMSLDAIAAHVRAALSKLPYVPRLVAEPGRGLVATAMSLLASVENRVERSNGTWLFLDCGVYNALFESLSHQGKFRYPLTRWPDTPRSSSDLRSFIIAGPTGDGLDILSHAALLPRDTSVGDQLLFRHVGAYTLAFASSFNGFPIPPVHVQNNTSVVTARRENGVQHNAP